MRSKNSDERAIGFSTWLEKYWRLKISISALIEVCEECSSYVLDSSGWPVDLPDRVKTASEAVFEACSASHAWPTEHDCDIDEIPATLMYSTRVLVGKTLEHFHSYEQNIELDGIDAAQVGFNLVDRLKETATLLSHGTVGCDFKNNRSEKAESGDESDVPLDDWKAKLACIPEYDPANENWISNKRAAEIVGSAIKTLANRRSSTKTKETDNSFGCHDGLAMVWRTPPRSQPKYYFPQMQEYARHLARIYPKRDSEKLKIVPPPEKNLPPKK